MVTAEQLLAELEGLSEKAKRYGQVYAAVNQLNRYTKVLLSRLFLESTKKTIAEREAEAQCSQEYKTHAKGLKTAEAEERQLRWEKEITMARIEVWRTEQANQRALQDKV